MMKRIWKKAAGLGLALTLSLSPAAPFAAAQAKMSQEEQIDYAGMYIGETMRMILEQYAGGDVDVDALLDGAMHGMMDALDDYSVYFSPSEIEEFMRYFAPENFGVGIMMDATPDGNLLITRVYAGSPGEKAGLKKGDVITAVNGTPLAGKMGLDVNELFLQNSKQISFTLTNNGVIRNVTVTLGQYHMPSVYVSKISDINGVTDVSDYDAIRVVEISSVGETTSAELKTAIESLQKEGVTKIILDLRGNGGGLMDEAIKICQMIVPKGTIISTSNKQGQKHTYSSSLEKAPFSKMVVLTDDYTASAAEVIASALQDSKAATVVGQTTFGKGVIQTMYSSNNGGGLKLTTEEYFRRNGGKIHGIGVIPDVPVEIVSLNYTLAGVAKGGSHTELSAAKRGFALLGYQAGAGNQYDDTMVRAVTAYQKAKGLQATGLLDMMTIYMLNIDLFTYYQAKDVIFNRGLVRVMEP